MLKLTMKKEYDKENSSELRLEIKGASFGCRFVIRKGRIKRMGKFIAFLWSNFFYFIFSRMENKVYHTDPIIILSTME